MVNQVISAAKNGAVSDGEEDVPPSYTNQIDENLRRLYDDLFDDEVPERFQELIDRLREQDENGSDGNS